MKKKKVLVIADSPLAPSGVGTQTKYMVESLLATQEYKFLCLAGAIKHKNYDIKKVEPYGEDLLIKPVKGYGDPGTIRSVIRDYKPDFLWFMTDPRFYIWLWGMENEIRPNIPMIYYHVWDNYPYPNFNKKYYDSNDIVCTISKVTDDIVRTVSPDVKCVRIPHTVDTKVFCKKDKHEDDGIRKQITSNHDDKVIFFWNNRNARRKQSGTLLFWFKEFLDRVGQDKAALLMHTEPKDPHGQDLIAIIDELGLTDDQVSLSIEKVAPEDLAKLYSAVDCTVNIADAEGFGLGTLESLACETPIIVNMTGGLQEQVTDGSDWFGIGIDPCSKSVIGSQDVPYIHEDRISKEIFLDSLEKFYNTPKEERDIWGSKGRKHVLKNYSFSQYASKWYELFKYASDTMGSWETRKNYQNWSIEEL